MLRFISNKKQYCVFDIGTDKVVCLIFRIENNKPIIIGMDHQKSFGFSKNNGIDVTNLAKTISKAFKKSLPKDINQRHISFFSNITDINLKTKKNYSDLNSGKLGVTKKDIRKIYKKSILESKIKGKYLIHSHPLHFRIDDNKIIDDPIGKKCEKFGISSFNMMVDSKLYERLNKCFKSMNIEIKNFFDSGLASATANLTLKEKREGVACIDIGSTTTKIVVFLNDKIVYSNVIPLGGENVSNDISKGLDIPRESAEHAKIVNGTLSLPFNEKIEINSKGMKNKIINKNILYGIIKPRYEEILEIIRDLIFDDIYARVSIKSIVITGGASRIFGLTNLSQNIFNRKVRIGSILNKESFFYNKPEFSTVLGLIKLAQENKKFQYSNELIKGSFFSAFDKLENWIEESYA